MAQAAPWEKYGGQTQTQAPVGYIPGVPDQPTPLELRRDERADVASARQAEAAARAARAEERRVALDATKLVNDQRAEARAEKRDAMGTEAERTAAFLATRLAGSLADIKRITSTNRDAASPELDTYVLGGVLPHGLTNSADRQRVEDAQLDILDSALTLGTGAAYTREQLEGYRQSFFPQYFDSPEAVKDKEARLQRVLDAARIKAGNSASAIDAALGKSAPVAAGATPTPTASQGLGEIEFGASNAGLPAGAREYQAEVEKGIQNGTITTPEQVAEVARRYRYAPPDAAETQAMFDALKKGARFGGARPPVYQSVLDQQSELERTRGDAVVDPAIRGVADTVTLGFADELTGIGTAIATGGNVDENIALQRGVDQFDEQRNFLPRIAGQLAGGFALPTGGASTVGQLAGVGAGYGAAYGFGSANGGLADRLGSAAVGGAFGGAIGGAGGSLAQRLAGRGGGGGGGNPAGREVYNAAIDAGITGPDGRPLVLPADVGGAMTRRMTAGVMQSPFGAGPVTRAAEAAQTRAGARLGEIAAAEGAPVRQEAFGETAQAAAQGYIDRTGAAAGRAYDRARELAGNAPLQGTRAIANIDEQLAELAATSNTDAPVIAGLQRLRSDLANGGNPSNLSIDAIRRLRTSTRAEAVAEGLRGTDYNRRAGMVLDSLSEDIASQLSPEAAAAFRNADRAYAERLNTIDDVMTQVIGPRGDRSAEAVANRLIQLGRGDSARLRTFLNSVEPEEAGIIRGSLIQEMGRSTSGQQTAAGDAFSLQTFLTNWDKMPTRTRDTLFRGEHRQAIEALARYAQGARESRAYANTSNTAGAVNAAGVARSAASGAAAVGTLGATAVLENLTGRLLGSRRFAQWLARAPRDPAQQGAWARRLGVIATREPALAPDIAPLQAALSQAPNRAAAEDKQQ